MILRSDVISVSGDHVADLAMFRLVNTWSGPLILDEADFRDPIRGAK